MKRFVEGMDRGQSTLFPECLEDWICEDNPVRVIDVFVGGLALAELRFCGVDPEATGRPSNHPSVKITVNVELQQHRLSIHNAGKPDHSAIKCFEMSESGTFIMDIAEMSCQRAFLRYTAYDFHRQFTQPTPLTRSSKQPVGLCRKCT
jgi:hypothetical protein